MVDTAVILGRNQNHLLIDKEAVLLREITITHFEGRYKLDRSKVLRFVFRYSPLFRLSIVK